MLTPSREEIYRYMGYRGSPPGEEIKALVEEVLETLLPLIEPRQTHQIFDLVWTGEDGLQIEGSPIQSHSLSRNLRGCQKVCLLAATIGPALDRLSLRAKALGRASQILILQAAGAALIEAWCDQVNERIRQEAQEMGLFLRPRFSPGYGDFPLAFQRDLFQILQVTGRTGISLSESLLMMPSKSVTALIGLSPSNERCPVSGCETCSRAATCSFRRALG